MDYLGTVGYEAINKRFLFVLLSAKRALQLQKGARSRVDLGTKKPTVIAMAEVVSDKVQFELPPRPALKAAGR